MCVYKTEKNGALFRTDIFIRGIVK